MPQKLNKAGKMQDYIPKGNGDASGEYGTSNGTNKNFTASDKKKTQANVINENKSVVVGRGNHKTGAQRYNDRMNKIFDGAKRVNEAQKQFLIDNGVSEAEAQKLYDNTGLGGSKLQEKLIEMGLKDEFYDRYDFKTGKMKDTKANIINDDLTGKKDNYNKALDDLKQWETYYDDDMDARTSKADARDKYIKNSDYVNEDTKLQNEYVFESMKGKDVNKIYDLIKETGVDPKSIYEKGKYPDAEFLVREKILKLIKDGKVKIDYSKKKIPTYGGRDVSNMVVGTLMENMRYELAYGNKFKNK